MGRLVASVRKSPLLAVTVALMMVIPGCTSLLGDSTNGETENTCEDDPSTEGCFELVITEDDCNSSQVFTGDYCRTMIRPSLLDFGENSVTLSVGTEMQALTPSFLGDAPSTWVVNPPLPDGISMDAESGVISGTPTFAASSIAYTILASNEAGPTTDRISIEVLPIPPVSIDYQSALIHCTVGHDCTIEAPLFSGGNPTEWSVEPNLPSGMSLDGNGSIRGTPSSVGESNHSITAYNSGGEASTSLRIVILNLPPTTLDYGSDSFTLTYLQPFSVSPNVEGGDATSWGTDVNLPMGLTLWENGMITGAPLALQGPASYTITATNSGGSIQSTIILEVLDTAISSLSYPESTFELSLGDSIGENDPDWDGGEPTSWETDPPLPNGFSIDMYTGSISGTAIEIQGLTMHTIWANNSGGGDSTQISLLVVSLPPSQLSLPDDEFAIEANKSLSINPIYSGPELDSWEITPQLPPGIIILENGTITGTPVARSDWTEYILWANNTGGSSTISFWMAVHDIRADQSDLLRGLGEADWGGWSSYILPIGEWAFPLGFEASGGPVVSASHVGRGKMLGYGHESWVASTNHPFTLRAVDWVCGQNADVGLAYGAGFDSFEDELSAEGHTVHLSVTPENLTGLDCLLDEFWNGHDDLDNEALTDFVSGGGGLIMGGHAWYWSYSNSDVAHNYPGNKIAKTTGLFVSTDWGYNDVYFQNMPDEYSTISRAVEGLVADRVGGEPLSIADATTAYEAISECTWIVPLDFTDFWSPLRDLVNQTGYTVIPYSTLWSSTGHDLGADPVADIILRLEEALMLGLPADELPAHPSHVEFPGEVPANATRITRTVSVNGTQPGLPSNFGYSGARNSLRMSTGLYAAPGEIVTVTVDPTASQLGFSILIGAHTDGLWDKDVIKRHSTIYRTWKIGSTTTEVANAFGGPIYVYVPAGSEFGQIDVTFSGAIRAPSFVLGETTDFVWITSERDNPAPWAEISSNDFIMTVPSSEIRSLDNPTQLMEWWDDALGMEHELYGFTPWPRVERAVFDAQISAGWMHSGYPFMAHDLSVPEVVNFSYMSENGDWGMFHELGHNHQWMPSTLPGTTETGCNFASVYLMEDLVGVEGHGSVDPEQRAARMESYFADGSNIANWSVWIALDTYLIVKEEWSWQPITDALAAYYDLPSSQVPSNDVEKFNAWVLHISNTTGHNLAPYHAAWGFPLTQDTFDALEGLPVWVDDPLRGEYFEYPAILRSLSSPDPSGASSTTISWETYDNGTNITLTIYYDTNDGGNNPSAWSNSIVVGGTEIGNESQAITGLDCCGTDYYARIKASNGNGETWFGPVSWTTDYLPD